MLKSDNPEQAGLQTKVLEINLVTFPNVADAILGQGKLTHYDRPRIAQLCEKAGLYMRALQHYTEVSDLKRCCVNTHAIDPQARRVVRHPEPRVGARVRPRAPGDEPEAESADRRQHLQGVHRAAHRESIVGLLEENNSAEGLFFYLGALVATRRTRTSTSSTSRRAPRRGRSRRWSASRAENFYDPEKAKVFLMEAKLPDARPLINVCDRFDFVGDLTTYLYQNNMMRYIEGYVQKVNPSNAPYVVGALLDQECSEDFLKNLILSVRSLLPVGPWSRRWASETASRCSRPSWSTS